MFCYNCKNQIPDGSNACPVCGAPQVVQPQKPASNSAASVATVLGILSLVLSIIGSILFGVVGVAIATVLGIVAIIMGINAKKQTNGMLGGGGFVCGLLGLIFGIVFAIGCAACGAQLPGNYGCYGCMGAKCAADDAERAINDAFDDYEFDFNW